MRALQRGSLLGPNYEIEERIGEGGMGVVYRGRDRRLGRAVALKILDAPSWNSPDALRRFTQEARTVSALNHPNIVTVYDVGEQEGVHFIAEELVTGRTLRERIREGRL